MTNEAAAVPRYAQALFEAARKAGEIEKVGEDLRELAQVLAPSGLKKYLEHPKHGVAQKREAILLIAKMFRSKLTSAFLGVLLDKSRIGILYGVATRYTALEHDVIGIVPADVILASAPSEGLRKKVEATLERITKKKVQASYKTDPEMLGGVFIRIKNNVIDGSIKSRIEELRRALLETKIN